MESQTAILIGAGLATCGWIYTNRRARLLSRKQHTINVMLQASLNKEYRMALKDISLAIRNGKCPDLNETGNEALKESLKMVSNHLEFIAAGLRNGDFDERLVKDTYRGHFVATFEFYEKHIRSMRNSRHRMALHEHLVWLVARWTTQKPNFLQRAMERVLGHPFAGTRAKI